jgi:hypothetical protein
LIVKILNIRCNDIENVLTTLENDMSCLLFQLEFLTIELKTTHSYDPYDYNYNDKYNINYGKFTYSSNIYLFNIIYYGKVRFVSFILENYINNKDNFEVAQSEIFINPTMFQLVQFTSISNDLEPCNSYIEGVNFLSKQSCNNYNILPEEDVTYLEMITF